MSTEPTVDLASAAEAVTILGGGRSAVDWTFVLRGAGRIGLVLVCLVPVGWLALAWSPIVAAIIALPIPVAVLSRSLRGRGLWVSYVWSFAGFIFLRQRADEWAATRWAYPLRLDTLLGGGQLPTVWLQHHLGSPAVDWFAVGVYLSYFMLPPAVAILLWLRSPELLKRYVAATVAVLVGALVVHFLVPTAPPHLASAAGVGPRVRHVLADLLFPAAPGAFQAGYQASANDVAAMPSVHMALACLASLAVAAWRGWRIIPVAYALLMAFAIVYLGEHYVVDAVAGAALAWVSWWCAVRVLESRRSVGSRQSADSERPRPRASDGSPAQTVASPRHVTASSEL